MCGTCKYNHCALVIPECISLWNCETALCHSLRCPKNDFSGFFGHTHVLENRNWEGKIHLICTSSKPKKEQFWKRSGRQVFFCSALKWFVPSSELGAIVQNCLLRDIFFNMQSHNSAAIHQKEMGKALFQGNFGQRGERNSKHKGKNQWIRNDFQAQQPTPPHGQSWSSFCWLVPHSAARLQLHGGIAHRAGLGELLTRRTRKFPDS